MNSDNIYQNKQKFSVEKQKREAFQGPASIDDPFVEQLRTNRRNNILVIIGFLMIILLAIVIIAQQQLLQNRPRGVTSGKKDIPIKPIDASINKKIFEFTDNDELPSYAIESLLEIQPLKIPAKGNVPLEAKWIKQAALHLVNADIAFQEERLEDSLKYYKNAIYLYPKLIDVQRFIGLIYLQQKKYEDALKSFKSASKQDPINIALLNNLAVCYLALENFDMAIKTFESVLKVNPDYPLAQYNLATLYYRQKNFEKAIKYFKSYRKYDVSNIEAEQMYANAYIQMGKWNEASEILVDTANKLPQAAPVHFRLAQALGMSGKIDEAMIPLSRGAVLLDPRKALHWLSRDEFDVMRNHPEFIKIMESLSD